MCFQETSKYGSGSSTRLSRWPGWLGDLGMNIWVLGDFNDLGAKGVHDHHRERKAVATAVDTVNQNPVAHEHAVGLQSAGQLLVRNLLRFAELFNEGFRPSVVKLTRLQFRQSYIVFNARIVKAFRVHPAQCIEFDACIKNERFSDYTPCHFRPVIRIWDPT